MKKVVVSNLMLKLMALVLAIITWFYISGEMLRQRLAPVNPYSTPRK